ncbi:hypothetical protein ACJMK2_016737 [Sinanodonta woodiana]|uniref:Nudix hydrolase domain-containing protein n=1 Tax=Sinanodonta woodiana TaxID=1069815 RepID=A0ABD3UUM2_SINWO
MKSWSDGLLKLVSKCNNFELPGSSKDSCLPFIVNGQQVGLVREDILDHLRPYTDVFKIQNPNDEQSNGCITPGVYLLEKYQSVEEKNEVMKHVLEDLRKKNGLVSLRGWRNETYDIRCKRSDPMMMKMERSGCCLFGTIQYGVHINGYFYDKAGQLMMWLGRRSKTKPTYPNMLDNMCAGGLSSGLGIMECAIKECQEEASVEDRYLRNLKSVGCISYCYEDSRGVHPECQFVFDLELSEDFEPNNTDGEVGSFSLHTIEEVKTLIVLDEFKPNCALVILDFLMRHGIVTPDNEPNYPYLKEMMHFPLQSTYLAFGDCCENSLN